MKLRHSVDYGGEKFDKKKLNVHSHFNSTRLSDYASYHSNSNLMSNSSLAINALLLLHLNSKIRVLIDERKKKMETWN